MRARHALFFALPWLVAACGSTTNPIAETDDASVDATVESSIPDATVDALEETSSDATFDDAIDAASEGAVDSAPVDAAAFDATLVDEGAEADADDATTDDADDTSDTYDATDTRDTAPPDTAWTATLCPPPAGDTWTDVTETDAVETDAAETDDAETEPPETEPPETEPPDTAVTDTAVTEAASCTGVRVRIVAANTTSGSSPAYQDPGIRIFQALQPDIALIQEFKYAAGGRALVDIAFGTTFHYYLESGSGIPNAIVSRYPILEQGEWDDPDLTDRDFVWARIDVPGPIDLWAVSVHLRTAGSLERDAEAKNLIAYITAKVPVGDYLVIGGDLNTAVETELALITLSSRVSIAPPYAVDQVGNNKTSSPRTKPYDWVLPSANLLAHMMPVRIGTGWFEHGFVFDTRVFTPISEVPPALVSDSAAVNMQHMAVVRDFALGD